MLVFRVLIYTHMRSQDLEGPMQHVGVFFFGGRGYGVRTGDIAKCANVQ